MAYATVQDLTDYMGTDPMPANPARLLDRASALMDELLIGAWYDVDTNDMPTDAGVIDALKRATLAQAHYMTIAGDETNASQQFTSVTQGSVSYSKKDPSGNALANSRYSSDAYGILRVAGLVPVFPIAI